MRDQAKGENGDWTGEIKESAYFGPLEGVSPEDGTCRTP
jgi:hypothetical protein